MYLSYCTAAPKLKSADINIYTIGLVTIFTGTLLVQIGGTLYVSTDGLCFLTATFPHFFRI